MAKKKFVLMKSKQRLDRAAAADFLRQLADKLESGTVSLNQAGEQLQLEIPDQVVLEVEAEDKVKPRGTKRQLEIEIEWVEGDTSTKRQPISLD